MTLLDAMEERATIVLAYPLIYNGDRAKSVHGVILAGYMYATHYTTIHNEKKQFSKPQKLRQRNLF